MDEWDDFLTLCRVADAFSADHVGGCTVTAIAAADVIKADDRPWDVHVGYGSPTVTPSTSSSPTSCCRRCIGLSKFAATAVIRNKPPIGSQPRENSRSTWPGRAPVLAPCSVTTWPLTSVAA
jgi:hypothetical protein